MNRRGFFRLGARTSVSLSAALCSGLQPTIAAAKYPIAAFNADRIDDVLLDIFGTTRSGQDASIRITVPSEAETPAVVPFRVLAPGAGKLSLTLDNHAAPLIMQAEISDNRPGMVVGMFRMQTTAAVTCHVLKQGQVSSNSRLVRLTAKAWDPEPETWRPEPETHENYRQVTPMTATFLKLVPREKGHDAICTIRYRPISGFGGRYSYITRMTFSVNHKVISTLNLGPAISIDPTIGVHISSLELNDRVTVEWVDTRANRGRHTAIANTMAS